jgi:flagellar biosynthesis/type III secretory pathway protein FliH
MSQEITTAFDVFYANIKFGLVPLSGEMQDHLRELEDRVLRAEIEFQEVEEEHHWGEGFDSGFSEGYEKGKEEGFDEGYAEHETEMKEWYEEKHR